MPVPFPRGTSEEMDEPGHWYRLAEGAVLIICPGCRTGWGRVADETGKQDGLWSIASDGTVSPSVHCHHVTRRGGVQVGAECGWHDFVKLEGYP